MSLPDPYASDFDIDACLCGLLRWHISELQADRGALRIPRPEPIPIDKEWQHFHLIPELFFQMNGINEFRFPSQQLKLGPNQIAVIPRQLAHQETLRDGPGGSRKNPFCNIVLTAHEQRLSYHVTVRNADPSQQRQGNILKFSAVQTRRAGTVMNCINELVRAREQDYSFQHEATRALSISLLCMLLNIIENREQDQQEQHQKISQCIEFIDYHIGNSMLSVNVLANWLGCHPDYLSKLFHQEQGERLNNYISEKRIALAKQTLRDTDLSITQIANASGFQDPAYFSRSFKKHVGSTPLQFRKQNTQT